MKFLPPYIITSKKIPIPFVPDWVDAITIFPFIFVKDKPRTEDEYRTIIEHEKIHIGQQLRGLLIIFYIRYLYFSWKYGYKKNPYEIEAYEHQDDWRKG
jgi:hypothetical protein